MFYDPLDAIDAKHVSVIAELGGIQKIKVFYTGHVTARSVIHDNTLSEIINCIISSQSDALPEIHRLTRAGKKKDIQFYHDLSKKLKKRGKTSLYDLVIEYARTNLRLSEDQLAKLKN